MAETLYTVGIGLDTQPLQQGLQQATRGLQTLGQAEDKLTQTTKQTEQATAALGKAETTLGQSATKTTQSLGQQTSVMGGLSRGLTQLGGLYTTVAAYVGGQFVRSLLQAGREMDSLQRSFRVITGSAEGARQELGFVSGTAQRLGVEMTTLAESWRGFAASARGTSLEGSKARDVFVAVSEASATLGLSSDATGRALLALQQILSKGKVSAEELRQQLGEALPGAFQIAARAMGVTTAELDRMLAAGELLSDVFLPKFGAQVRKELGLSLEDATKRAGAGVQRLWNVIREGLGVVATQSGVITFFDTVADRAAKAVQRLLNLQSGLEATRAQLARQAQLTEEQAQRITTADLQRAQALQTQIEQTRAPQVPPTAGIAQRLASAVFGAPTAAQRRQEADARERYLRELRTQRGIALSVAGELPGAGAGFKPGEVDPAKKRADALTAAIKEQTDASKTLAQVQSALNLPALQRLREHSALLGKQIQEDTERLREQPALLRTDDAFVKATRARVEEKAAIDARIEAITREQQAQARGVKQEESAAAAAKKAAEERFKAGEKLIGQQQAEIAAYSQGAEGLRRYELAQQGFTTAQQDAIIVNDRRLTQLEKDRQAREAQTELYAQTVSGLHEEIQALILSEQEMEKRAKTLGLVNEAERENIRNLVDAKYALAERAKAEKEAAEAEKQALKDRIQAMHEAASLIEEEVRGPDPERRRGFRKEFDLLEDSTATFADNFIEEIQRATESGAFSFKRFADSAIQDLLRILQQQVLGPQIEKLLSLGINAATSLLGGLGGGGAGAAANLGTALGGTGGLQFGQTGGPLRRGLTLVGEAGPEAIATRGGRSMVFPTSHPVTRAAMRSAGVPRRQYGGPLPSAVMGGTGSEAAMTTMGSGQGATGQGTGNVYITVYAQDAASFQRSRGEIQRQMKSAFAASQRS